MPFIIHQRIELRSANAPLIYQQEMELGDRGAHQWRVTPVEGGAPADLSGAAVSAFFRRADGSMLSVPGTIDGGDAVVLLPAGAYGVEGFADGVMRIAMGGGLAALAQLRYRVARHSSDTVVDPDHVIPDISELLAQIEAMKQGTAAANTAAADANTAAGEAYDAATAANTSARAADTAASSADSAADRAGAAAQQVTDAIVPSFSIGTVTTLPAGSQASATITGNLPKNPVLNLGLPKGRDGDAGEGVYGSTIAMSAEDPTKVKDAIEAAGKVETVAGVGVTQGTKNVPLTGADLPLSGTDATKVKDAIEAAGKVETVAGVGVIQGTKNVPLTGADLPVSSGNSTKISAKLASLETTASELKMLKITFSSFSSLPQTVRNAAITTDMVCIKAELGTPSAQTDDWTINTDTAGQVTVSGSISGSTTLTLYLAKTR